MMTYKQKTFIGSLMKDLDERGVEVVAIPDVAQYLQDGEYGTSTKQASDLIKLLLEEKKSAPEVPKEKVETRHIQKALVTLMTKKRKNKTETQFAIQKVIKRSLNKSSMYDLTYEELLAIENILTTAKYIK